MVGAQESAWAMLKLYSGNGSLTLLFAAALVYLWITEKNKGRKAVLVYLSLALLGLFFFPLFSYLMIDVMGEAETYYRFLWALPMGIVISYAAVKVLASLKKKWMQAGVLLLLAAYIAVGGHLVYKSPQFSKAQNLYQVPDTVVSICEAIEVPGREVKAIFPHELIQYTRQYSPYVVLAFGYDAIVPRWNITNAIEEELRKEVSSAQALATMAIEENCHFIVLNQGHLMDGSLSDYDYSLIMEIDGYDIYKYDYANL